MRRNLVFWKTPHLELGGLLLRCVYLTHVVLHHAKHLLETGWLTDRVRDFIGIMAWAALAQAWRVLLLLLLLHKGPGDGVAVDTYNTIKYHLQAAAMLIPMLGLWVVFSKDKTKPLVPKIIFIGLKM